MTTLLPFPRLRKADSAPAESVVRNQQALADGYGRVATDLRVSLTDRCNLRCAYCMPAEGLDWLPGAQVLTDDEIVRLITIGVERLGISTVRLTGGEPLLRKNLELLVADIAALSPTPEIALTTNAIGLAARAEKLAAAGLRRINISLDTLDPDTFSRLSRRRRLPDVLAGIAAARQAGLQPVKINTVLMRGINDREVVELLYWAMAEQVQLRFIEQMPLDPQHGWQRSRDQTAARRACRAGGRSAGCAHPGQRAGRAVPGRGHRLLGRHHRSRLETLLRRMRQGTAYRRRPDPELPVRANGIRPSYAATAWRERCRARRALGGGSQGKATRPRHQRSELPATGPAHVGDRRLVARYFSRGAVPL